MKTPLHILLAQHSRKDAASVLRALRRSHYQPIFVRVDDPAALQATLDEQTWDIIVADDNLPGFSALSLLGLLKANGYDLPSIFISNAIEEANVAAAFQAGAHDFILKNNLNRLGFAVSRALCEAEMRRVRRQKEEMLREVCLNLETKVKALQRTNRRLKRVNKRFREMSREDPLTGLLNRRVMLEMAMSEWGRWQRYGTPFSIMIIDLDDFKSINDRYGHLTGDRVLKIIANTVVYSLRGVDMIGRYGGEEFVVILPETGIGGAITAGENLLKNIRQARLRTDDVNISVTASIGIAAASRNHKKPEDMLQRADMALYSAKRQGKDRLIVDTQNSRAVLELLVTV